MWIFNVSGFDAVELSMKNGKIYRIGTDEPEKLETAIKQACLPVGRDFVQRPELTEFISRANVLIRIRDIF